MYIHPPRHGILGIDDRHVPRLHCQDFCIFPMPPGGFARISVFFQCLQEALGVVRFQRKYAAMPFFGVIRLYMSWFSSRITFQFLQINLSWSNFSRIKSTFHDLKENTSFCKSLSITTWLVVWNMITMWGPPVISWFIIPSNYSYKYHKP